MSWDWVIRQLQGERAAIPKAGGRLVINMGMNGYMTKPIRTELRELIVELLTEVGELSTQDLHQQVLEAGVELSREALYSVCKKMKVKGQLQMRTVPRPDNFGKGISLWSVK
jgi:hypothetical protein